MDRRTGCRIASLLRIALPLVAFALGAGCTDDGPGGSPVPEPPPDEVLREALLSVLGADSPEQVPADRLRIATMTPDGFEFREPDADERAALWIPEGIEDVAIEDVSCRFFPIWRVVYRPAIDGREGPPLVSEVVPVDGVYRVLMRWRAAMRDDEGHLVPDFRPNAPTGSEIPADREKLMVVAQPPWVDLRPQQAPGS
ncbi:MAG: hypothetical protein Kow0062_29440 [Acidobacteriota bacterium]